MMPVFSNYMAACETQFLGLNAWFHYLRVNPADCSIAFNFPQDIPLILLAIIDDLLRVAAVVAVFYVIYGGIKYVTSQGSPDNVASAQRTVLNALIGLVIALLSVSVVAFLGSKFGGQ
jgi:hypothetical protein